MYTYAQARTCTCTHVHKLAYVDWWMAAKDMRSCESSMQIFLNRKIVFPASRMVNVLGALCVLERDFVFSTYCRSDELNLVSVCAAIHLGQL